MSEVLDNTEWKRLNDQFRSPKARRPDVYYIGYPEDKKYVILADGWESKGVRRQKWIPTDKATVAEVNDFGREEAAKLAVLRGVAPASGEGAEPTKGKSSAVRTKKGDVLLGEALEQIEADELAGVNARTGGNTTAGCRTISTGLPPDRLLVPVNRVTPKELKRHVKLPIVEDPDLTVTTKKQYLSQARSIVQILIDYYGLDIACKEALRTPANMTGADADERPFRLADVRTMENAIGGEVMLKTMAGWTETIEGAYYGGTNCAFQPVDLTFLKWDDMDTSLEFIDGRRFKTKIPFYIPISKRFKKWLLKRRTKGGVWGQGYVFPELVYGINICNESTGPLAVLTSQKEKAIATNATERLRDYFNKFLTKVCGIKRPGISYKSFRHYILPYLRAQNVPAEVGKDIAGQLTLAAYLGYGGHGTPQQLLRATGLLEEHFENVKAGRRETIILTHHDLAKYIEKVQLKGLKKLLLTYHDCTAEVVREVRQGVASQTIGFETTHAKLDALNGRMKDIEAAIREPRNALPERVIATGALILSFSPIQDLDGRERAARPDDQNNHQKTLTAMEIDFYAI